MSDDGDKLVTEPMMPAQSRVASSPIMPQPGELFADRYRVQRLLGRGGMGEVYLAVQSRLERPVAVKILKPPSCIDDDPKFDERFLREAAAAANLNHANTITVHDFGQTPEGHLFIVMEYLEGQDLRTVLRSEGTFSAARCIHVAVQICKSLREAHGKGMVHRDLKPANVVLVERDGDRDFLKVLDFGLVKYRGEQTELTLAGKFVGSPKYTSPEALDRRKQVDHRADIYSLGVLVYTMLAGEPPFVGDPMQILAAHLHEEPSPIAQVNPLAQTTPALEEVVQRCLRKNPEERFQSMDELLDALREADKNIDAVDRTTTLVVDRGGARSGLGAIPLRIVVLIGVLAFLAAGVVWMIGQQADEAVDPSGAPEGLRSGLPVELSPAPTAAPSTGSGEGEVPTTATGSTEGVEPGPAGDAPSGKAAGEEKAVESGGGGGRGSRSDATKRRPAKQKNRDSEAVPEGYKDNPY
ncbi:MAG: protein kinase [Myxococcota bacterium]|nr:protein kinase [Myxococcota bacterium]